MGGRPADLGPAPVRWPAAISGITRHYAERVGTVINIAIALVAFYLIMRTGMRLLGGFAQPMAEPPPPGEMRKVRIEYRCDICGSEARMTMAPDEDPPAPRHCLEDMRMITPVE